jgi:hypothetical protein
LLCGPLFGLYDGSAEDQVVEKLGKADQNFIGGNVKKLTYQSLHARFFLAKQKVYMLSIFK